MNNRRRFVDLVVNAVIGRSRAFTLHRIDVSRLFYPTKPPSPEGGVVDIKDGAIEEDELPHPTMTFHTCPGDRDASGTVDFMPLGSGKKDIVVLDQNGRAVLYDAASQAIHILPPVHMAKYMPINLTVGNSLYLMRRYPSYTTSHFFESLVHAHRPDITCLPPCWYWRSLPPPPFAKDPRGPYNYVGRGDGVDDYNPSAVEAYTVVNGSDIWVTHGGKTYSFDTVSSLWRNIWDWTLPFQGQAEYVPEHKLWFGLSANDDMLCASDLSNTSRQPQLRDVWMDLVMPDHWFLVESYLVPLGLGKFCIGRFFETAQRSTFDYDEAFVVLTGVEVERCGKDDTELRMVKHRSRRYNLIGPYYCRAF